MYILRCKDCGKMYKANKEGEVYRTDFNDLIDSCFCGGELHCIDSADWVADLVFKIKGK